MGAYSWPTYAMLLANAAKLNSEHPWDKVGACALRADHSVISTGYNNPPSGISINWDDQLERNTKVVHAEANCLDFCRRGEAEILAVTLSPCAECMKLLASKKVKEIYYLREYDKDVEKRQWLAKEFRLNITKLHISDHEKHLFDN